MRDAIFSFFRPIFLPLTRIYRKQNTNLFKFHIRSIQNRTFQTFFPEIPFFLILFDSKKNQISRGKTGGRNGCVRVTCMREERNKKGRREGCAAGREPDYSEGRRGGNVMQLHSERGVLPCIRALEDITPCVASPAARFGAALGRSKNRGDGQNIWSTRVCVCARIAQQIDARCPSFESGFHPLFTTVQFDYPCQTIQTRFLHFSLASAVWRRLNALLHPLCPPSPLRTRDRDKFFSIFFKLNFYNLTYFILFIFERLFVRSFQNERNGIRLKNIS